MIIRPSQKCGGFFMPDPDHLWDHLTLLVAQNRADNNPNWPRIWDLGYARGNSRDPPGNCYPHN